MLGSKFKDVNLALRISRVHEIRTETEIEATPERVWSILTDFPAYADWNPFMRRIDGVAKVGGRLKVLVGTWMAFRPTVLTVNPNRELRWRGRLLVPGIFDGEHYFQMSQLSSGRVKFIQGE